MAEHHRACASCGATNEEDARFCEGCGGALGRACGTCGVEANATARFCRACGAPLDDRIRAPAESPASGPSRKTVTVMFADLAGSTTFEEQVDAETAREVMSRYHDLLRSTAERNRAGVTKYIGDGFMAVWGVPEIGPDDADHAVDAAVELQEHFIDFAARATEARGVDLALRVAVNTGEVVVGAGDADLVGDALNVAARLEAECPRGRVVVGEETWRSTRGRHRYESLGHVQVKGRTAPVPVYQWLGRQSESTDSAPFVGRADEIRRLQTALDDAIAAQAARLVTVIGDPGVGKSRLAAEFTAAQGDVRVVEARCDVEGTVALAPIVEVLRARDLETDVPAGVPERDRMLRDLNGLTTGVPGSVEETFWALRRYIEMQARDEPLVIVVDDIQWADTLLLDFIEHLVEWVQDVPVLVLALARPELREVRPDLVTVSEWVTEAVHLGGLDPAATAELAAGVLGAARLPSDLLSRLPASTGGNPLFVRELVGMLVHDGVLVAEPAGWRLTIDVDAIAIPPTIQALLASRLERLNAADRRVLEIASVVGTDFSLGAICALAERGSAEVKGSLDRLRRLELAQPSGAYLGDEKVWRFHHVLIRDVAYRRLLKSDRADLHERLANWLEAGRASVAFDSDEMIARHLEAANGYRLELGMPDEHTGELALRSARRYLASARRALDRDELISAGTQAARGAALAAADNAVHAELLLIGCEAFLSAGDVAAGAPLVDDLDRVAGDALAPWATCYRCQFIVYTDPDRFLEVDDRLQGAIDEFGRRRDPTGLAKAHRVRASTRFRLGRIGDAEVDLFEALIAARQGGDHRQITAALGAAPSAALWGPSPVPKAGGRCLDVVRMQRMTTAAPSLEATSLRCLAVLELLRGRPDKARSMLADARQVVADLGLRHGLMETELFAGFIESMVGDEVAAEPHFRTAMEGLDALGVGADAGQAAALLARSVLAQGRLDEADRYAAESERLAGHNLKTAIAWRAVRAEILAAQGMPEEAFAMANDAVAVAAGTDLVLDHAEACLALGRVLAAAGDDRGAAAARRDSEALYEAKGAASSIGRVVEPPAPAAPTPEPVTSRLTITNRASEDAAASWLAMAARDVDTLVEGYAERFVYDDRRRLSGDAIIDRAGMRAAFERVLEQFTVFEGHAIAVRGERLALIRTRWSDDAGNETTGLFCFEADEDGRTIYAGRFDEDDFESAYRELEHRYYAGEGAAFTLNGHAIVEWMAATDRLDVEAARSLAQPDFRWLSPPSTMTTEERSVDDAFRWLEERARQVSSVTNYHSVVQWLSPTCAIGRGETRAIGLDGEEFEWSRIYVGEYRDGLLASIRQFELDDEDAAFAYAETLVTPPSRLAISNRASESAEVAWRALRAHDVDTIIEDYSDRFVYDDHRRLSGDPIVGLAAMRAALERIFDQYSQFELRVLAVRGERLLLASSRWSDDAGNETSFLHVAEIDDDGRTTYDGRFDADDFNGAYRELENRYYAGEGSAFALNGRAASEWMESLNRVDVDAARPLAHPEFRWIAPPTSLKAEERSVSELFRWLQERANQVSSLQHSNPVLRWLSPNCNLSLGTVRAVGLDGEAYEWTRIYVSELRDGLLASVREFETDQEEAAFAYAANLVTQQSNRLTISNRASESADAFVLALEAHDVDGAVAVQSDRLVYEDRRRLSGDPIEGLAAYRTAVERVLEQYPRVEWRTVAVRGDRLALTWGRWSDDAGNESAYLAVFEVDDDGQITHHVRFDGDDFDGAYRELERRYYEGEGAPFALNGQVVNEMLAAMDRLDVDAARSLVQPEFRWLATPSAVISHELDGSVDEFFVWLQERGRQVSSLQHALQAMRWVSPNCCIALGDVRAIGLDGEDFEWTNLCVGEFRGGLLASVRQFGLDEEDAAFAYAESLITPRPTSRLAVNNRAGQTLEQARNAMRANDAYTTAGFYADLLTYDDRRRISGDPIYDRAGLLAAAERILAQYNRFDSRTLAARGELLQLSWERWADDAGNETTNLRLIEVDEDGLIAYEGRFDEDDFEGAYRELERRYYAGEGAAFAANGQVTVGFLGAMDRLDVETARRLTQPEFLWLATPSALTISGDLSVDDLFGWLEERRRQVSSVRHWAPAIRWLSPNCCIGFANATAVGLDSEDYEWTRLYVVEFRDGLLTSIRQFELDDEDAAFAYAEERMRAVSSRLAVSNTASETMDRVAGAMQARDVHRVVECYADSFKYDDRRRLSGDPFAGRAALRVAVERILAQYTQFEGRTLAVRGERLQLTWTRSSDDAGNESTQLHLIEVDDDARIAYEGRFDGDNFEGAYRELDRRYYAGEGAAFAESGATLTEVVIAANRGELDRVFGEFAVPGLRFESRSHSVFPNRTLAELRSSLEELNDMVASIRQRYSAVCWLSPNWFVARQDREAVGLDGEKFEWTRLYVGEIRDGLATSFCDFDLEDEDAAFMYAEERMRASSSRLALTNRATEVGERLLAAFREKNVDAALDAHSDQFVYDDRRRLPGDPLVGRPGLRAAHERVFEQYSVFDGRTLAIRGERLQLSWSRWSDDAGNATTNLHVFELGDDGRISFHGRFEEDDFEDAYRELERRYYAGEGAAFAEGGAVTTEWITALNRGDFDRLLGELSTTEMRVENRSRSAFPNRSAAELRASFEDLGAMVASVRARLSVAYWLSPTWCVARHEREAVGPDGEQYAWTQLLVAEFRDGRIASIRQFELDDEEAAFAYAEERMRATTSRLALTNRATEVLDGMVAATHARDIDATVEAYADEFVYDDRRRLSGDAIEDHRAGLRAASERILEQYSVFDVRTLAVRGERLLLAWTRWSDDSGNETTYLHVLGLGDEGRIVYAGRFDEDDFESAYRELEHRYYAGEGSEYAEPGAVTIDWITGLNQGDFDRVFGELTHPELRVENRSRSAFPDRSGAAEFRAANEKLKEMVASARLWIPALCWLSPSLAVGRFERDAVGRDGEQYAWSWVDVFELRDRRLVSMCRFELDDEDAAFAYAEERMREASSRLAVSNRASEIVDRAVESSKARDFDAVVAAYSDQFVFDDRRRLGGDPIEGSAALRAASERVREQYSHVEPRNLAVRGARLLLASSRWSDDSGNETAYLHVIELDDDGRIAYDGRFDEDDFEGAYRELERRYYAGEGAAFAEAGAAQVEWITALNRGDLDRVGDLYAPEMRVENRSRTGFPDRSASDLRASFAELNAMVASTRTWPSAVRWVSPTQNVTRLEREAVGADGEHYEWTRLLVNEFHDGLVVFSCEFELEDEDAAFAYAEERARAASSRLALANRATEVSDRLVAAMNARDIEATIDAFSDQIVYDDRRRLSGDPIEDLDGLRSAFERIFEQYSVFESRTLAVRGLRLALWWSRWSDDSANETDYLHVFELDDDGQIVYAGRFDEDDFEGAYREFERRYYAGEGAQFAEAGSTLTNSVIALNRGDLDRVFGELSTPDASMENRSRSVFGDRSAEEFRASIEELNAMVASQRVWYSAVCWLSPAWAILRAEREAVGHDGEQYTWTKTYTYEIRDGLAVSSCEFEPDDEESAFAYAEERMRATSSRLALTNRASEVMQGFARAFDARDADAIGAAYSEQFVYDDRRRLSGDPIAGYAEMRAAAERVFEQYSVFESRTLAVRGERLELSWSRWSDDAGNTTDSLGVFEVGDDGRIAYGGRFDEDDFEGAYRELERRYYAGEGAQFAEAGAVPTDWMITLNRGDFDRAFGELITADFRVENRSRSGFPDRSAAEFRAGLEELDAMVASTRNWFSATCWVSPAVNVCRYERETVGRDGEHYAWTRLLVCEVSDGRLASMCEFELDDEEAAFVYTEERIRAASSRLAVTNRASATVEAGWLAVRALDLDSFVAFHSDRFEYDDRRRLSGDSIEDSAALRKAIERIVEQYPHFEWRTLAVRGERLALMWSRCWDDAGNEAKWLHVFGVGDDGRITYNGRFDEDDFEGAYRELERRHYAGEGAAFVDVGATVTDYAIAMNRSEFDRAFGVLTAPGFRLENRSRSGFGDRSAAELRATYEDLTAMVESARIWYSALCWLSPTLTVGRFERDAVGRDGEHYTWTLIQVAVFRDGRIAFACQFDIDNEEGAFEYAEERVRAASSRLAQTNGASEVMHRAFGASKARDFDAFAAVYADQFVYDDRRQLSGDPIVDRAGIRAASERLRDHYSHIEPRTMAVRGERLALGWSRWSDDAGNEATYLDVVELGDDGRITYNGRFDEDDFEGAYRELERRYYAGEGAAFADGGAVTTEWITALNRGDFDRLLGELSTPEMRVENRSRSAFPNRSAAELRASFEDLGAMVASARAWLSVAYWLSATWCVARHEREAVGREGEQYAWTQLLVGEFRGGRCAALCEFELDAEAAAFAYAEERMRAASSRLSVTNRASETVEAGRLAMLAHDVDAVVALYSDRFEYDDRRRLSGGPRDTPAALRAAVERLLEQYPHFEWRRLAVRGERLELVWSRWWDDAGNETSFLHVAEIGDDGRIIYDGRFDEDDFEGAYRELTRRYGAGEGSAVADVAALGAEWMLALNRGDFDCVFGELTHAELRIENRSSSVFPDRSAGELRASLEELYAMVASARSWNSAEYWLDSTCGVVRQERQAVGLDGEKYSWTRLFVFEARDGRATSLCEFELGDEAAAFAYAEEWIRATEDND